MNLYRFVLKQTVDSIKATVSSKLESHSSTIILLDSVTLSSHCLTAFDHFSRHINRNYYFNFFVCCSKNNKSINCKIHGEVKHLSLSKYLWYMCQRYSL